MKYGIVGSRKFNNYELLKDVLDRYDDIECIVSGACVGTDVMAEDYADEYSISKIIHEADWKDFSEPCSIKYNKYGAYNALSGFKRNTKIVNDCDILIAFIYGESSGTKDSIKKARKAGKEVIIIDPNKLCQTCKAKCQFGLINHTCDAWEGE